MEFFILLVLSFCCCQATPLPTQEVDCNDPKVFNAVDLALQKFNRERTHGNQFALDVVTEADKTAGPGPTFLVKYRLRETVCAVGGGIPWQNCEFREPLEADSGECTAQVYIDDVLNLSDLSQECKIIPAEGKVTASRAVCTGCWGPLATDSLELLPLVRYTIRKFNDGDYHPSLFEVLEITKAQSQVVAGWNYAFEYLIKETNCSKEEFPYLTPACKRIPEGREGKCLAVAHINISKGLSYAVQECALQVKEDVVPVGRRCPGCPLPLASNSEELEEPLRVALEKYNSESNDKAYYKVEQILKATVQVVAGKKYMIDFILVKTNCSKADLQLGEVCSPDGSNGLTCEASIYVIPWESKVFPNVTCFQHRAVGFGAWPPGMTPFRSLQLGLHLAPTESRRTVGNQATRVPSSRRGLGTGLSRALAHEHGDEQAKEKSSEESHEGVKNQEVALPEPVAETLEDQPSTSQSFPQEEEPPKNGAAFPASPTQQDSSRESHDFSNSDLLPEPGAPKCPGKPWKPIIVFPSTNPELVSGAGDGTEHHETASPPSQEGFDLADALSAV